jgi:acyl-CoA reductase-like NAD-dependent aldehyde dehydrogenase
MSAVEFRTHQSLLYIDGAFMPATGGATFEVINPSNEKVLAHVAAAQLEDIDKAVTAAHRAFSSAHKSTCLDIHSLVGRPGPMKGIERAR